MVHTLLIAAVLSVAALGAGCAKRAKPAESDYSGQAKYAFDEANEAFESNDYLESLKKFNFVRTKFPYSKYAALAALRIGDVYFEQEQMPDAVAAYRRFVQLHPTHPEVAYAQYRIGLAFYEQLPGDWFFMPPSYERDLASTEDAERECKKFLEQYPNSQYAEEVAAKLTTVRQRLADHEFYVATFYLKRDRPRAAAMRLTSLIERYPGLGFDEEALFLLGKSYLLLNDVAQAAGVWTRLIDEFPSHDLAGQADVYMQRHSLKTAMLAPAKAEDAARPARRASPVKAAPKKVAPKAKGAGDEEGDFTLGKKGGMKLDGPDLPSSLESGEDEDGEDEDGGGEEGDPETP